MGYRLLEVVEAEAVRSMLAMEAEVEYSLLAVEAQGAHSKRAREALWVRLLGAEAAAEGPRQQAEVAQGEQQKTVVGEAPHPSKADWVEVVKLVVGEAAGHCRVSWAAEGGQAPVLVTEVEEARDRDLEVAVERFSGQ